MYTTKSPIDMCRFNVRSSTYKNLKIFCKRQILIKLFYLYQRLQCRDNYFFKIKFVFFLYLRLSASWKENDLLLCIYFWYQTDSGYEHQYLFSGFLGVSILQLLIIYRIYQAQASDQFLATNKAICLKTKKINKSKMYF